MVIRNLQAWVLARASEAPVLTLTGPRQAGKTTLVRQLFPDKPYVSLENLNTRAEALEDPEGFLGRYPQGAILDEIQACPSLLSFVQGIVTITLLSRSAAAYTDRRKLLLSQPHIARHYLDQLRAQPSRQSLTGQDEQAQAIGNFFKGWWQETGARSACARDRAAAA